MASLILTDQETLEVRKFCVTSALGLCARGDTPECVITLAQAIEAFIVSDTDPAGPGA